MTQLQPPISPSNPDHRLLLSSSHTSIDNNGQLGRGALQDVYEFLCAEVHAHATREPRTQEQSCYLVGWHDALHSLWHLATRDISEVSDRSESGIAGVPSGSCIPIDASLQEATDSIMRCSECFMDCGEQSIARLDVLGPASLTPGSQFGSEGRQSRKFGEEDEFSESSIDIINTPSIISLESMLDRDISESRCDPKLPDDTAEENMLHQAKILNSLNTQKLLTLFERQSRISEHKIAAELAKTSVIRQAIFQDRFFGRVPSFDWDGTRCDDTNDEDWHRFGNEINFPFVGETQQQQVIDDARKTFRSWRRNSVAFQTPLNPSRMQLSSKEFPQEKQAKQHVDGDSMASSELEPEPESPQAIRTLSGLLERWGIGSDGVRDAMGM